MAQTASRPPMFSPPRGYLLRCVLFLALIGFPLAVLLPQIHSFFFQNPLLNALILFTLGLGIVHTLYQILRLSPEISWARYAAERLGESFDDDDDDDLPLPVETIPRRPNLLAPLAALLEKRTEQTFSTTSARFLLDTIATRLDEARGTSRYLIGLLIFLGLLGTFWGLLETITAIGDTVRSLGAAGSNPVSAFEELRAGLEAPLAGMGTAFSSSLFGLAGSLILGFLDLQSGQAQTRFYNELEEFVASITHIETRDGKGMIVADATASELHVLEDIRRLLMVAEGERAVSSRTMEAIAQALEKLAASTTETSEKPSPSKPRSKS